MTDNQKYTLTTIGLLGLAGLGIYAAGLKAGWFDCKYRKVPARDLSRFLYTNPITQQEVYFVPGDYVQRLYMCMDGLGSDCADLWSFMAEVLTDNELRQIHNDWRLKVSEYQSVYYRIASQSPGDVAGVTSQARLLERLQGAGVGTQIVCGA